jgi:flavin-binding protein dodecin
MARRRLSASMSTDEGLCRSFRPFHTMTAWTPLAKTKVAGFAAFSHDRKSAAPFSGDCGWKPGLRCTAWPMWRGGPRRSIMQLCWCSGKGCCLPGIDGTRMVENSFKLDLQTGLGSRDKELSLDCLPTSQWRLAVPDITEMKDHVYKILELVGSSEKSIEDAIQNAVTRASKTIRDMKWFEVVQTRGHIENGAIRHYQVTLRVGFTLER